MAENDSDSDSDSGCDGVLVAAGCADDRMDEYTRLPFPHDASLADRGTSTGCPDYKAGWHRLICVCFFVPQRGLTPFLRRASQCYASRAPLAHLPSVAVLSTTCAALVRTCVGIFANIILA